VPSDFRLGGPIPEATIQKIEGFSSFIPSAVLSNPNRRENMETILTKQIPNHRIVRFLLLVGLIYCLAGLGLNADTPVANEPVVSEATLDEHYFRILDGISEVRREIYNGYYHGSLPLKCVLKRFNRARADLVSVSERYRQLDPALKVDRQIGQRFFVLGKMGLASLDAEIMMVRDQQTKRIKDSHEKRMARKHPAQRRH
jgi:hypothetical protein